MIAGAPIKAPPKGAAAATSSAGPRTLPWLQGVATIAESEAAEIKENLIIGLEEFEKGLDGAITHTNKRGAEAFIWQTIDAKDNGFLADLMIQAGMRIPAAAAVVRALANSAWELRLAGIVGPRFMQTWEHYTTNGGPGFQIFPKGQ